MGSNALEIPSSVRDIGDFAFSCASVERLYIPDSVRKIGEGTFMGCMYMKTLRLSDSLRDIPKYAFSLDVAVEGEI